MDLHSLAQEVFLLVIEHLIRSIGIVKALRLRPVNKKFNHAIQHLVFTTQVIPLVERHSELCEYMSPPLKAQVLLAGSYSPTPSGVQIYKAIAGTASRLTTLTHALDSQARDIQEKLALSAAQLASCDEWRFFERHEVFEDTPFQDLLCGAVIIGDLSLLRSLLDTPGDEKRTDGVSAESPYFGMPLHLAAAWGYKEIVEYLLENGADAQRVVGAHIYDDDWQPNIQHVCLRSRHVYQSADGNALRAAALSGHEEIVRLLLSPGYGLATRSAEYYRAILAATRGGHTNIIDLLLDAVGTIIPDLGSFQAQMLHEAVRHRRTEIVQMLLEAGANVNFLHYRTGDRQPDADLPRRKHGTVLHVAAAHNYTDIIQILLDAGARTTVNCPRGFLPIETAGRAGHEESVALFLHHPNNKIPLGPQRAFISAAYGGQHRLICRFLHKWGVDLQSRFSSLRAGSTGRQALLQAIVVQNPVIINMLIDAGVP